MPEPVSLRGRVHTIPVGLMGSRDSQYLPAIETTKNSGIIELRVSVIALAHHPRSPARREMRERVLPVPFVKVALGPA